MDPKKIAILVLLLLGLVFAGRWACHKWQYYNPPPSQGGQYGGAGYGGAGYGKAAGKNPGEQVPPAQPAQ